MADNTNIAIKLMYFGHNYPHDFIEKVWMDDPNMSDHLKSKFSGLYERYGTLTFFKWIMELGGDNKSKLITWVNLNYTH